MLPPRIQRRFTLILFLLLAGALEDLEAAIITLSPLADTTLSQLNPNNNFGGETSFSSGFTDDALTNRALLKFDVASKVPSNAIIEQVTLTLTVLHSTALQPASFS